MLVAVPPMFTTSMNSPAVLFRGSLAEIAFRMSWAAEPVVIVKTALLVSDVALAVSVTRTRAVVDALDGTAQAKVPAAALVLLVIVAQVPPVSREYSSR